MSTTPPQSQPVLQPAPTGTGGAAAVAAAARDATPYLPRWGVQTGFFQRRQPAFWMFVVLLVLTALTVISEQLLYLQYFASGWIVSIVLLALYVVPVLAAIYVLDLFEREPLSLLIAAFLWGGVVSIGLAVVANSALLEALAKLAGPRFAQTWGAALVAPPVEETFKVLGVITIYLIARSEIDDLFDGFVYGAVVGLGFAAVENVQYFIQSIGQPGAGDQIGPVLQMFFLRAILVGLYMHAMWTGLSGLGVAYYITQRHQPRQKRLLVAVALFVLGIVAHVVWNSPLLNNLLADFGGIVLFGIIKGLPFLGFLILLVYLAQRREHRWFRTITATDVGTDVLPETEFAELGGLRSRWAARRRMRTRKGAQGAKLTAQLQREQINLAMIRSRAGTDDDPAVIAQRERIREVRAQLDALPDVPQPVATPYVALAPAQPTMQTGQVPMTQPTMQTGQMPAAQATTHPGQVLPTQPTTHPGQVPPNLPTQAQMHTTSATQQAPAAAPTAPAFQPSTPTPPASPVGAASPVAAQPSATPTQAVSPAAAPSPPPPVSLSPAWMPTHVVPMPGIAAWAAPDPAQPPVAQLAPGVQLAILEQWGAWSRVVGSNGWTGWVDGRLLLRVG